MSSATTQPPDTVREEEATNSFLATVRQEQLSASASSSTEVVSDGEDLRHLLTFASPTPYSASSAIAPPESNAPSTQHHTDPLRRSRAARDGDTRHVALLAHEEVLHGRAVALNADSERLREVLLRLRGIRERRRTEERCWEIALQEVADMLDVAESALGGSLSNDAHSDVPREGADGCEGREGDKSRGETECVIDLEEIKMGEVVVRLPCFHVFHADCIFPYFANEERPLCPIDRTPVPVDVVPLLPVWKWGES